MSIKIVTYTDPHVGDNCPPSRRGSYRDDILAKIQFVLDLAKEEKAYSLCAGDLWDQKPPTKTSHYLVGELQRKYMESDVLGGGHLAIPGNHDITQDRMESIPNQPIGVLFGSCLRNVVTNPALLLGVDGPDVEVVGVPFSESPNWQDYALTEEQRSGTGNPLRVLVVHQYFSEKAGAIHGTPVYAYSELDPLGYDVYLYGHYHVDQGVTEHLVDGRRVLHVNVGSISRGGYGDDAIVRIPKCCVLSFEKGGIQYREVEVPCRPAADVFDLEFKELEQEHNAKLDSFVSALDTAAAIAAYTDGEAAGPADAEKELEAVEASGQASPAALAVVRELLTEAAETIKSVKR